MSGHSDQVKEIRTEQRRVVLMLVLTFVTGVLDAVGYLGLDKVFTGNMTGIVISAMGLGGAVRDMTTVVVTSTLTSLAGENFIRGRPDSLWNRRAGAICIIFAGAGVGTLLLAVDMTYAIAVSAIATATVAIIGHCSWDSPTCATRDLTTAGRTITSGTR